MKTPAHLRKLTPEHATLAREMAQGRAEEGRQEGRGAGGGGLMATPARYSREDMADMVDELSVKGQAANEIGGRYLLSANTLLAAAAMLSEAANRAPTHRELAGECPVPPVEPPTQLEIDQAVPGPLRGMVPEPHGEQERGTPWFKASRWNALAVMAAQARCRDGEDGEFGERLLTMMSEVESMLPAPSSHGDVEALEQARKAMVTARYCNVSDEPSLGFITEVTRILNEHYGAPGGSAHSSLAARDLIVFIRSALRSRPVEPEPVAWRWRYPLQGTWHLSHTPPLQGPGRAVPEELYALYASPVAPAWQPIETAPKDGTSVLIAGGTYYYDAGISSQPYPAEGVTIARWDHDEWNGGYGSEYDGEYWHLPTVWMPLPVAPREPEK